LRTAADTAIPTAKGKAMPERGRLAIGEGQTLPHGVAIRVEVPLAMAKVGVVEEGLGAEGGAVVVTVVVGVGDLAVVDAVEGLAKLVLEGILHRRRRPRHPLLRKNLLILNLRFEDGATATKLIFKYAYSWPT
jgi:hypothetical protein